MSRIYHTIIIERKQVAQDTLEVSLKRPDRFSFQAGQYIQLGVPELLHADSKGRSRVMSIASSPLDQEKISVVFRETGSGLKKTFKELPIGDPVVIEGPHGFFTLPKDSPRQIVLVAGGIGIAPYLSMLRYATAKGLEFPITLLYVNRSKEGGAYLAELQEIARRSKKISFKNKFGRIDEQFIRQNMPNIHNCIIYIAGPSLMIDFVRNLLFLMGVDDGKICYEDFVGY